ncbi:MAG: hypothetical protein K0Q58_458 [Microbacterium sp.]|jgi:WXG100 family type VII secretion target|nr:hypothetical protein [Microbacterium sp.]
MDHLEVNPAKLSSAAAAIETASTNIDETIAELQSAATTLRAQWTGEAQEAFDHAQARFAELMESRTEVVRVVCDALETLAVSYSTLDLEAARALGATA